MFKIDEISYGMTTSEIERKKKQRNLDTKFRACDAFLESLSSGTLKVERLEREIILNVLEASEPKVLNRIAKNYIDVVLCCFF